MEYTHFIADFSRRTLQNLDHIQAQAWGGDEDVYPVTQLWNSLLGLVVLPRERDLTRIPRIPMTDLWSQGWPRLRTTTGSEHRTLLDLVSDLRRAVAHFNVDFRADPKGEINTVIVWTQGSDQQGRPVPGSRRWEGHVGVEDLNRLARSIAALYLKEFAGAA